jgi:hypothetical protein
VIANWKISSPFDRCILPRNYSSSLLLPNTEITSLLATGLRAFFVEILMASWEVYKLSHNGLFLGEFLEKKFNEKELLFSAYPFPNFGEIVSVGDLLLLLFKERQACGVIIARTSPRWIIKNLIWTSCIILPWMVPTWRPHELSGRSQL